MADTSSTKFQKGVAWGSLFSTIADYTIWRTAKLFRNGDRRKSIHLGLKAKLSS